MEKFEILATKNGQHRFNLVGSNGEIILPSESYHNRKDMIKTMRRLPKMIERALARFEKEEANTKK